VAHQRNSIWTVCTSNHFSWEKCVGGAPVFFEDSPAPLKSSAQQPLNRCLTASITNSKAAQSAQFKAEAFVPYRTLPNVPP